MYSLACRLAKTESILETFGRSLEAGDKQLVKKREKLKCQLEEAQYLNSLVKKRAQKVVQILDKYFKDSTAAELTEILDTKLKIIVELKELDETVCLSKV